MLKLSPKHTTIDLEIKKKRGTMTLHPPRIFSHSHLYLSLDSYVYVDYECLRLKSFLL